MTHPPLGPYHLHEVLGRGGMGTIYLGVDQDNGQRVAIKVLAPSYANHAGFRERFEAEILSLEKLKHPNIVELYGYGEQEGILYYAMELIEGPSLQHELRAGRRFGWREVIDMGVDICHALKHAHDHGIVHRDIKPANLLLVKNPETIKLSDFGISKLFGNTQITIEGGVVGTADYMSPEQAEGSGVTIRSDLYSLGGVLYCLLAGRPPFLGKSIADVLHQLKYNEPIPLQRFVPDVPQELDFVVQQLLSKDPKDRIPTARALANRLNAIKHALSLREDESGSVLHLDIDHDDSHGPRDSDAIEEFAERATVAETPDEAANEDSEAPLDQKLANATVPTPAAPVESTPTEPNTPRPTYYTAVDNDHRRLQSITDEPPTESIWNRVGVVVCLLGLIVTLFSVVWHLRQPPTADQLYAEIELALDSDSRQLFHIEDAVQSFMARFPDDERYEAICEINEDIDLQRLERQLEVTARLRNAARFLAPVEQATVDAIRQETLNPETAASSFAAIIAVFDTDPDATAREKKCIRLARRHLQQLNTRFQRHAETAVEALNSRLNVGIETIKTDPVKGTRMLNGIIHLYQDKPWASRVVSEARAALDPDRESTAPQPEATP